MSKLPDGFEDFSPKKSKIFEVTDVRGLQLELSAAQVAIVPSTDGKIHFAIDAEPQDLKRFGLVAQPGQVGVREEPLTGNHYFVNKNSSFIVNNGIVGNNNIVGNGNVIIGNNNSGRTIINGRDVTGEGLSAPVKMPRIVIKAPAGMNLNGIFSGVANIVSTLDYKAVDLQVSGSAKMVAHGNSHSVKAALSGSSNVTTKGVVTAGYDVATDGSSKLEHVGDMRSVRANLSGSSRVSTEGMVTGNYDVSAEGSSRLKHVGTICGRTSQIGGGSARINMPTPAQAQQQEPPSQKKAQWGNEKSSSPKSGKQKSVNMSDPFRSDFMQGFMDGFAKDMSGIGKNAGYNDVHIQDNLNFMHDVAHRCNNISDNSVSIENSVRIESVTIGKGSYYINFKPQGVSPDSRQAPQSSRDIQFKSPQGGSWLRTTCLNVLKKLVDLVQEADNGKGRGGRG